jgi:hypothetical protein
MVLVCKPVAHTVDRTSVETEDDGQRLQLVTVIQRLGRAERRVEEIVVERIAQVMGKTGAGGARTRHGGFLPRRAGASPPAKRQQPAIRGMALDPNRIEGRRGKVSSELHLLWCSELEHQMASRVDDTRRDPHRSPYQIESVGTTVDRERRIIGKP